jgi:chorismate synthase
MAGSSFGTLFRFTTWGESHGPALGVVVDGVPSRLPLAEEDIQHFLDRRRPGQSRFTTQRQEPDRSRSSPACSRGDHRHAGLAPDPQHGPALPRLRRHQGRLPARPRRPDYDQKYGIRDYRGGGRSSARETACRVAAGAIARKVLGEAVRVRGWMVQMGADRVDPAAFDDAQIDANPFFCPDAAPRAAGRSSSWPSARRARRWARWSRWWRPASRRAWASRSTTSSTRTSRRR